MTPTFWVQNLNISREATKRKIAWPSTLPRENEISFISSNCEICKSLQQRTLAEPIFFSHIHNTSKFEEIEEPSILFSNCLTLWTDERESFFRFHGNTMSTGQRVCLRKSNFLQERRKKRRNKRRKINFNKLSMWNLTLKKYDVCPT